MNTYPIKKWTDNSIIAEIKGEDFKTAFEKAVKENIDFSYANLKCANLNLFNAYLEGANIDFSCWPLWCGSANVKGDERQAKQLLAHAFNFARKFWPGDLTPEQKFE